MVLIRRLLIIPRRPRRRLCIVLLRARLRIRSSGRGRGRRPAALRFPAASAGLEDFLQRRGVDGHGRGVLGCGGERADGLRLEDCAAGGACLLAVVLVPVGVELLLLLLVVSGEESESISESPSRSRSDAMSVVSMRLVPE